MAFSTIQGSGAPDTFVGTSGVDAIALVNSAGSFFLGAQEADDNIQIINSGSALYGGVLSSSTLKGGAGVDTFTIGSAGAANQSTYTGVFFNGNAGRDTFAIQANDTLVASTLHGGAANDTVTTGINTTSLINGNKGIDTITTGAASTSSTIFGGGGGDILTLGAAAFTSSLLSGDKDNDTISVGTAANSLNGSTFLGGAGVDSIVFTGTGAANDVILIGGGDDVDTLTLAAGHAATSTTIDGGSGNDVITTGAAAGTNLVTVIGGSGSDQITAGGADAVRLMYTGTDQGGAGASTASTAVAAAGDTITGLDIGAAGAPGSLTFSAAALVGTGSALDAAGAWDMNTAGVYNAAAVDFNQVVGTATYANVAAAVTAVIGTVTGDVGDVGYIVFGGGTAAANDAAIVQVTLGSTKAGVALNAADQVAIYAAGGAGTAFDGTINFVA